MARSIWTVASELAEELRETPQMKIFRRAFDEQDLRVRLSQLTAIYSALREHELLLGVRLNHMGPVIEGWVESDQDRQWLESAIDAGTGFQVAIEYIRSHLPSYPYLQVPHLRRGSPLDFAEGALMIDYFPWQREMRGLGSRLTRRRTWKAWAVRTTSQIYSESLQMRSGRARAGGALRPPGSP